MRGEDGRFKKGSQSGANTQFKKGNVPWNKNMKGIHFSPKSEWKEGDTALDKHPFWKGGVQKPKKDCVQITIGKGQRARKPVLVWEAHNKKKVPIGYVIYHKDGNMYNDNLSNLECISRAELMKRNSLTEA